MVNVKFLYHSAFVIENDDLVVLIDAFRPVGIDRRGRRLYVLSSHFHQDHYDPWILSLDATGYYLSSTIRRRIRGRDAGLPVTYISQNMRFDEDGFTLETFDSTDCGVSFVLTIGGRRIVHLGDDNDWDPSDEAMHRRFIASLMKMPSPVDVALVPLDPHLGRDMCTGPVEVMRILHPDHVVPMHCWQDFDASRQLEKSFAREGLDCSTIVHMAGDGQHVLSLQEVS